MPDAATAAELFPAPAEGDWRTRPLTPTWGSHLKVRTPNGRLVEGTILSHEPARAGVLVTLQVRGGGIEEFVVPHLEITVPLPLDEGGAEQRTA